MNDIIAILNNWAPDYRAGQREIAELIYAAEHAEGISPGDYTWKRLEEALVTNAGMSEKKARAEVRRCRIQSDLGTVPQTAEDFIPLFIRSRGYSLDYNGNFRSRERERDINYVLREIALWCGSYNHLTRRDAEAALLNWQADEVLRVMQRRVQHLAYDPDLGDRFELKRLAHYLVTDTGDAALNDRNRQAAEVALANFIHRVKNHMRGRWSHGSHLMPVLFGPQGCGKSTLITHLLTPLEDFYVVADFGMMEHTSTAYDLTRMPVMFFDEMPGIGKADLEKLKGLMTSKVRQVRQSYEKASLKTLMSTFIAATNKEIDLTIRDETGNRRFLQIDVGQLDRATILGFDALAIWRSIDEDADAPLFAEADGLAAVQQIQTEQRYRDPVERWLSECSTIPRGEWMRSSQIMEASFRPWAEIADPTGTRYVNEMTFGRSLSRLAGGLYHDVVSKRTRANTTEYRFVGERSRVLPFPKQ
ncbi:VapE domain-containing protein [Phenylobacterium terrae]|uniref:VapE domain-containing protein n=1 Tax=Phenylobacterium terrae TaxID=2665495 RepID=A0ABW4N757_9CAUL